MPWTTPPTWAANTIVASSDLQIVSDDLTYLKAQADTGTFQGCYLSRSTNLSIPTSTSTDIPWLTELYDIGGWHAANDTQIIVPAAAIPSGFTTIVVEIMAICRFATNNAGIRALTVVQNGSQIGQQSAGGLNGDTTTVFVFAGAQAGVGDVFKVQASQTSGSTLNAQFTFVSVKRLGAVA